MANIETQFLISKDIKNHVFFFKKKKKNRAQATSLKPQANKRAGGTQKVQAPGVGGPIVHKRVIHRLSTEKIFSILLMGFSMKRWEHEKSKNYCSCQPAHDQIQPEKPRGVSGSNGKAQRQDLLCSRSQLSRKLNNPLQTNQAFKLWGCVLGRDRGRCDSLRLDRGFPKEASFYQVRAQDGSPARISEMDQLGNFRAGQERRPKVRCRARPRHRSRNFKSCPGLGQLSSNQVYPDLGKSPNLKTHKQQALKHQA
jgi:hypothetical protein